MSKICKNCGQNINDDQIYCPYCGEKVGESKPQTDFSLDVDRNEEENQYQTSPNLIPENEPKKIIASAVGSKYFFAVILLFIVSISISVVGSLIPTTNLDGTTSSSFSIPIGNIIMTIFFFLIYNSSKNIDTFTGKGFSNFGKYYKILFIIFCILGGIVLLSLFPLIIGAGDAAVGTMLIVMSIITVGVSIVIIIACFLVIIRLLTNMAESVDYGTTNTKYYTLVAVFLIISGVISLSSVFSGAFMAEYMMELLEELNINYTINVNTETATIILSTISNICIIAADIIIGIGLLNIKKRIQAVSSNRR